MDYYVYENWRADDGKAKIHTADCSHCKQGQGKNPDAGTDNGRWLGPFDTLQKATNAAQATDRKVSNCQHCSP